MQFSLLTVILYFHKFYESETIEKAKNMYWLLAVLGARTILRHVFLFLLLSVYNALSLR